MSALWGTRDLTGHWVKIRVDGDPPLPEKTIMDRCFDSIVEDHLARPPWYVRINSPMPWEHRNYEDALSREVARAVRAAKEWEKVARVEDADRRYARYLERHPNPAVKAVRRIHDWDPDDGTCTACRSEYYDPEDSGYETTDWPCPTIQAVLEAVWA